jgi:hypothetical protein
MPHRSSHPIESPHEHNVEFMTAGISQQLIQAGAFLLSTGNLVTVFVNDFIATLLGHLTQVIQLCFGMLVDRGDAGRASI